MRRLAKLRAPAASALSRSASRTFSSAGSDYDEITVLPLFASETVRDTIQQGLGKHGYCIIHDFAGAEIAQAMRGALACLFAAALAIERTHKRL